MRKKISIEVQHKTFGVGTVKHRKITDSGDAIVIQFGDKTRLILVSSDAWVNPDIVEAAFKAARELRPKEPPRKVILVRPAEETVEVGEQE